jgi:hypothetical protein
MTQTKLPDEPRGPLRKLWDGRDPFSGGRLQAFLGEEELITSEESYFTRRCRRFALRDIRGVILAPSPWRGMMATALLLPAIISQALSAQFSAAAWAIAFAWTSLLWIPALIVIIRGPRKLIYLVTPVQVLRVGTAVTRSKAAKALTLIEGAVLALPGAQPLPTLSVSAPPAASVQPSEPTATAPEQPPA